jgi:hypothetical protein
LSQGCGDWDKAYAQKNLDMEMFTQADYDVALTGYLLRNRTSQERWA